jgi:hypothetical protein
VRKREATGIGEGGGKMIVKNNKNNTGYLYK